MKLFHPTFEFFRQFFFKHKVNETDKTETLLQDQDRNTKLERNTGTVAESVPGNDTDTQLKSHAADKLSWT